MELFTHYYLAKDSDTGQDILDSAQDYPVIVIRFADGHYVVIDKTKLKNILSIWHALQTPLAELPENVFLSSLVTSVEASDSRLTDIGHVNRLFGEQEYLVVTRDSHIIGLLVKSVQVRGLEKGALVGEEPGELFINTDLEGYDRTKPLELNKRYLLAIWIAQSRQGESVGYTGVFQTGEEEITLSVRLESDDFSLEPKDASGLTQRTIRLQRKGSLEKATFDIQPLHPGEGFIRAYFFKGLQFIQVIQVRLFTGKLFDVEASGLSLEASFQPERRRDLSLIITETDGGFHLVMAGAVAATAFLPISANYLAQLLTDVREELKSIVHFEADGQTVYQQAIDIPQAVADDSLKKLAFAGYKLFRKLFYGPEMDSQVKQLGDRLSQMAQAGDLNIQIYSQHFMMPWGVIYLGNDPRNPDPSLFLGLRHVIEHIPLQQSMRVTSPDIDGSNGLQVSLNVNAMIDQQMKYPLVENQETFWENQRIIRRIDLQVRRTGSEVENALGFAPASDQIFYFYCHAVSHMLGEKGGPGESRLVFADKKITLDDLYLYSHELPGAPLIFINACESAELSPLFYDGFVPYFMSRGARGVIGTECEVPALFAMEWANRFFSRFLKGEHLGKIVLDLRKEFYQQHHNLLGLLYAIYANADTRIVL